MPISAKTSRRLAALAAHVLVGRPVADIGTDHALLPVLLVTTGRVPSAIGVDRRPGPLRQGELTVGRAGCLERIDLRLGEGLEVVRPGEVATIVVAGMGGPSIAAILAASASVVSAATRLVLQPNEGAPALRGHLAATGWCVVAEDLVEERGRFYPVIVAEPGAHRVLTAEERLLGAPDLRPTGPTWNRWLESEHRRLLRAVAGASRGTDPAVRRRLGTDLAVVVKALRDDHGSPSAR